MSGDGLVKKNIFVREGVFLEEYEDAWVVQKDVENRRHFVRHKPMGKEK